MMKHVQTSFPKPKLYQPPKKRTSHIQMKNTIDLEPRIIRLHVGENATEVKMGPDWYHHDNFDAALTNIVYPEYTEPNEHCVFDTVARYRAFIGQSQSNFRQNPLSTGVETTEALIIALAEFAKRLGGELSFTNQETPSDKAVYRTACGVANMNTAHLLATNLIPTAKFSVLLDQDYHCDITRSHEKLQKFVLDFVNEIVEVLKCEKDYVRVMSVEQPGKTRRRTKIKFGLTTTNPKETEALAERLKVMMSIVLMLFRHVM